MEQIKNVILGPRYALRLEDLGRWHRFEATCIACRHRSVFDPERLRRRWPKYTRILELEKLLRCTVCGNRSCNQLKVGRLARD